MLFSKRSQQTSYRHPRSYRTNKSRARAASKKTRSYADSATLTLGLTRTRKKPGIFFAFIKRFCLYFLALTLVIGWGSLPIFLPYFRISTTEYSGLETASVRSSVQKRLQDTLSEKKTWWPSTNFFLLDTHALEQSILEDSRIHSAVVTKKFPHTLVVSVVEKKSSLAYFSAGGLYAILDEEGGLRQSFSGKISAFNTMRATPSSLMSPTSSKTTESAAVSENNEIATSTILIYPKVTFTDNDAKIIPLGMRSLPRVVDFRSVNHMLLVQDTDSTFNKVSITSTSSVSNTPILDPKIAHVVLAWADALSATDFNHLSSISIDGEIAPFRLIISTNAPWDIISDTTKNPVGQIEQINLLLKNQKPQHYIDTRFDGRLYWK